MFVVYTPRLPYILRTYSLCSWILWPVRRFFLLLSLISIFGFHYHTFPRILFLKLMFSSTTRWNHAPLYSSDAESLSFPSVHFTFAPLLILSFHSPSLCSRISFQFYSVQYWLLPRYRWPLNRQYVTVQNARIFVDTFPYTITVGCLRIFTYCYLSHRGPDGQLV